MYRYRQCRRTEPRATTRAYVSIRRASTPTSRCTTLCGNQSPLSTCVEASHHRYNEAAASVVSGSVDAVLDLYALVVGACGGPERVARYSAPRRPICPVLRKACERRRALGSYTHV